MTAQRVGLVRLSAMGDVVQSLGAVQALLEARPELELHFVTQTENVPLLDGLGLASVIAHHRGSPRGLLRTRAALRALRPDRVVDLQGNWKSALVTRLSGAPIRTGAAAAGRQEPASAVLLNDRVSVDGPRHPAAVALQLLRRIEPALPERCPALHATTAEVAAVAQRVRAAGLDPTRPFVVCVVTDPRDVRAWPVAAIERQVQADPEPALWLRGPAEPGVAVPDGEAVLDQRPGQLRELVALGRLVAEAGGRVLGPDRGAVHVLNASGAETSVFFGPQDPVRTAPPGATVLLQRDGPDCRPCRRRDCRHRLGPVCMDFTVAEAREARQRGPSSGH